MANLDESLQVDLNNFYSMYVWKSKAISKRHGKPFLMYEIRDFDNKMVTHGHSNDLTSFGKHYSLNESVSEGLVKPNPFVSYFSGSYSKSEDFIPLNSNNLKLLEELLHVKFLSTNN